MHTSSHMILITLSKCAQIKVGVSAVTLERGFLMKFMIHMDNRQADNVCLITYPSGPERQSSNSPRCADTQEVMTFFKSHVRLGSVLHVIVEW